jgi:predicted RNA-binding Zn-ribbon protein involved in translation (DUF1610 family)
MELLQNIHEVLKTIKRRKPSKIYCPRCGSPSIHVSSSTDWITTTRYLCDECGYLGPLFMELEKEEE